MGIETWLVIGICILSFIILLILKLEWCIDKIRDICKDYCGFIKFTQTIFMILSWSCFFLILFYYLFFNNTKEIPVLEIFLTVIVGFLGTMIGLFFSNESLMELKEKQRKKENKQKDILLSLKDYLKKQSEDENIE